MTSSSQAPMSCCSGHKTESVVEKQIDSVCKMTVDVATAKARYEHNGTMYYFCCQGCSNKFQSNPDAYITVAAQKQIDPVCKMTVEESNAKARYEHNGTMYFFCCQGCSNKFQSNPDAYLQPQATEVFVSITPSSKKEAPASAPNSTPASAAGASYTCPMHPEVITEGPTDCPLCGMPLEPMMPSASDDAANAELKDITRRFALSAALTVPVVLLSMKHMFGGTGIGVNHLFNCYTQMALATPVVAYISLPFFARGLSSITNRSLNMFTLLSLGIGLPYLYSALSLLAVTFIYKQQAPYHMVYFESAVVIATLAWLGQFLEAKARASSTSAVRELVTMLPTDASVVLPNGTEVKMPISDLAVHAKVRVRPGERIAVDGKVVEGQSSVNESILSGEPMPVFKQSGSAVKAGTINGEGSLVIDAEKIGAETMLSQIVQLVSQAQRSRVPVQQLADRVAATFVPLVLTFAFLTMFCWLLHGYAMSTALTAALAVLVVACPCALGLATPMSIVVSTGRAAKAGVLFKEARALQLLSQCNTVVLDKTGTLTIGAPKVVAVTTVQDFSRSELIALAASIEHRSEHPLAKAIINENSGNALLDSGDFTSMSGLGASGKVDGKNVAVGSLSFMQHLAIDCDGLLDDKSSQHLTSVYVGVDGVCKGRLDFDDELRPEAATAVKELQSRGVSVVMATGDALSAANRVATALGITTVHASMLPAAKAALVKELQSKGARVAMAGDGINDAPALAQADVGMAMGSGTDVALYTADIILMNSSVQGIVRAHKVSKAMIRNIAENLVLAFGYNVVAIPVASGLFASVIGYAINPMAAALGMSLSSVAVIANALRLKAQKL